MPQEVTIHESSPCVVVTRKGHRCGCPSVQLLPGLGSICALHAYHQRRARSARANFQVRVDANDLEALDRLAKGYGMTRSDTVRRILHHLPPPRYRVDAETYLELRRQGVNLNQVAKALNRGDDPDLEAIQACLDRLNDRLEDLALRLCVVPALHPPQESEP